MNRLMIFLSVFLLAACASGSEKQANSETALPPLSLEKIAEGVWVHKSYKFIKPWGPILSQGLVVERNGVVVLTDTAWTNADTEELLSLIDREIGIAVSAAVITHAHDDKIGGISVLHERGIVTMGHSLTQVDAAARGFEPPQRALFAGSDHDEITGLQAIDGGGEMRLKLLDVYYPGAGHTRDNIVVYDPVSKVLFGGCLIRPGLSKSLGNTADADLDHWWLAVKKVAAAFPDAEIVIPSHGPMGGRAILTNTIRLAKPSVP